MPKAVNSSPCDALEASVPSLLQQLEEKYEDRDQGSAWAKERESWETILNQLSKGSGGIRFNYRIERVLGVGGAGAVFRAIDCNLFLDLDASDSTPDALKLRRSYRALKVPRPHIEKGLSLADSLRDEISRLTALSHTNVVNLFAKGQIGVELKGSATTWPWYVMGYVHGATDLDRLCAIAPPELPILARYFYDVACGLQYIHENNVVHCDVKPANIFLSEAPDPREPARAILADFGYAKHVLNRIGETTVGFTDYFAHPDLASGSLKSSQGSRTFNRLPRDLIRTEFDLFAFGMTIHYLLEKYYRTFTVHRRYGYEIKYLRLCAARLLDGLNHQKGISYAKLPDYAFRDVGNPGTSKFILGMKYRSSKEVVYDLEKLLGYTNPELEIPELVESRRENIQVSDTAPAIYTHRLRMVVDHPLVRRLASASQLGLVSLVYPGATHTRLEHALGTFGVTARYLRALFNDTLDPLFRQMATTQELKATLLAALLHDIGQYPLAHDLEDVSSEFFSHEKFGEQLLSTEAPLQPQARLFEELGREPADLAREFGALIEKEWGISLDDVRRILLARSSEDPKDSQRGSHIDRLCKSLIDGPIDADKVDYLQRDSRHCNTQYGNGIDLARLLRCLTVAYSSVKDDHLLLAMGVHEKGRISAESVLFARYAMLTQVYWHHTMRAVKALLHHAAAEFLSCIKGVMEERRQEFFRCALLEEPLSDHGSWERTLIRGKASGSIHAGDLRVLGWLWGNTSPSGREAIEHILNRNLFKRLVVIYRSEMTEKQRTTLDRTFRSDRYRDRCGLRDAIEHALIVRLKSSTAPNSILETQGFSVAEWMHRLDTPDRLRCLVDYPTPRPGASFGLQVVRQWGERPPVAHGKAELEPSETFPMIIQADHFRDGMKELEKSLACLRIYWRPDEHVLVRELGDDEIRNVVLEEVNRFKPGERNSD